MPFAWAQIFEGLVTNAVSTLFTVPVGHTYVLRDIEVNDGQFPTDELIVLDDATGQSLIKASTEGASQSGGWRGRVVLNAGQVIKAYSQSSVQSLSVVISGYDLT